MSLGYICAVECVGKWETEIMDILVFEKVGCYGVLVKCVVLWILDYEKDTKG